MPIVRVDFPTGSDEEMVFTTFRGYLSATCNWTRTLYPHRDGLLPSVADAVKSRPWIRHVQPRSRALSDRAAELLRNGWATEVLLNSPRVFGGGDLIGFANLWAPVQAYYAVFEAFSAVVVITGAARQPKTHAALLKWAGNEIEHPASPFVIPWTARVLGAPPAWQFHGFGAVVPDPSISNLSSPSAGNAPHLLAKALKTTRDEQIRPPAEVVGWPENEEGHQAKAATEQRPLSAGDCHATHDPLRLLWRL